MQDCSGTYKWQTQSQSCECERHLKTRLIGADVLTHTHKHTHTRSRSRVCMLEWVLCVLIAHYVCAALCSGHQKFMSQQHTTCWPHNYKTVVDCCKSMGATWAAFTCSSNESLPAHRMKGRQCERIRE